MVKTLVKSLDFTWADPKTWAVPNPEELLIKGHPTKKWRHELGDAKIAGRQKLVYCVADGLMTTRISNFWCTSQIDHTSEGDLRPFSK